MRNEPANAPKLFKTVKEDEKCTIKQVEREKTDASPDLV